MIFQAAFHFEGGQTSQLLVVVSFTFLLVLFFLQHNTKKILQIESLGAQLQFGTTQQHSCFPLQENIVKLPDN